MKRFIIFYIVMVILGAWSKSPKADGMVYDGGESTHKSTSLYRLTGADEH